MKELLMTILMTAAAAMAAAGGSLPRKMSPQVLRRVAAVRDARAKDVDALAKLYERYRWKVIAIDDDLDDGEMSLVVGENVTYDWNGFAADGTPHHALRFLFVSDGAVTRPRSVEAVFNDEDELQQFEREMLAMGFAAAGGVFSLTLSTPDGRRVAVSVTTLRDSFLPRAIVEIEREGE